MQYDRRTREYAARRAAQGLHHPLPQSPHSPRGLQALDLHKHHEGRPFTGWLTFPTDRENDGAFAPHPDEPVLKSVEERSISK